MVEKLDIESFLDKAAGHPIIDVRSPAEFEHAHIPGAVSLPLFSNEERAIIGTLYKQQGRETAMLRGLEFYSANMHRILSDLKQQRNDKQVFVHCWRGGMRSGVVAWMLDLFGYKVSTLNQGYKAFRKKVIDSFSQPKNIVILGGKTGSAKTETLNELKKNGEQIIDLEALAHHKGSAFGDLGEAISPSQEQFENDLFMRFRELDWNKRIWVEDESQRIGWINLPNALWQQMRSAKVLYIEIAFEERLNYLVNVYGGFSVEDMKMATLRMQKRLGGLNVKNAIQFFDEGKIQQAFEILLTYYDKAYSEGTAKRNPETIHKIECPTIDKIENTEMILKEVNRTKVKRVFIE